MSQGLIIVPDIHGRQFWKEAVPFIEEGTPAVFLGDYTDPYSVEGISNREAVENLEEIVAMTRSHEGLVTLLLGNHDLSYFGRMAGLWNVGANRYSERCEYLWYRLFNDNMDLFSLCTLRDVGGRRWLLSHAGIHPRWVNATGMYEDIDKSDLYAVAAKYDALFRSSLLSDERTPFMSSLAFVGHVRGGRAIVGSPVWADCSEFENVDYEGYGQIFGHSQQLKYMITPEGNKPIPADPFIQGNNYCVDCRRCFILADNGLTALIP